jgi:uncharacterized FAD-dependent dehydrogenase
MGLCPEWGIRASMSDAEYWAHVFDTGREDDYDPDTDEQSREAAALDLDECPVCHGFGPCGYDAEGLPLIHVEGLEVGP